jgi:DNA-directed RNA polymerase specialized sigma24 family protein
MSSVGSVSIWLVRLKAGDRAVVQKLFERYFQSLVDLARKKLLSVPRAASDEVDVAQCAFDSFCRRAEQGRFPRLDDRDDLWEVLVLITARKAHDLKEHEGRKKRNWRRTVSANQGPGSDSDGEMPLFAQLISREPDPGFAAEVAEQYRHLLDKLGDDALRTIVQRKLEGYNNEEIRIKLNCSLVTVERRLRQIRKCWKEELPG